MAQAEALRVTPRVWKILALGALVIAAAVAFATTEGRSSSVPRTPASWGLYSPKQWAEVTANLASRGLSARSIHVVTGMKLANGRAFALIGGQSDAGHTCVAVARGVTIGDPICRIVKPLLVFYAPDKCNGCSPGGPPTDIASVLALVRVDVTATMISQGRESGVGVVPAGAGFAFNSSARIGDRLRARDASGRVLADIVVDIAQQDRPGG